METENKSISYEEANRQATIWLKDLEQVKDKPNKISKIVGQVDDFNSNMASLLFVERMPEIQGHVDIEVIKALLLKPRIYFPGSRMEAASFLRNLPPTVSIRYARQILKSETNDFVRVQVLMSGINKAAKSLYDEGKIVTAVQVLKLQVLDSTLKGSRYEQKIASGAYRYFLRYIEYEGK